MKEFYTAYYAAVETSRAHRLFCERVFGLDLAQHGFADVAQLELLLDVSGLAPGQRALDLGRGNGGITGCLAYRCGASFTGVDFIEPAVAAARRRTEGTSSTSMFLAADINRLPLASATFDLVISIDTAYFADDLGATVKEWARLLRPAGQLAIFYSHGREPSVPVDQFPRHSLPPDRTPLARALTGTGFAFNTWDLTRNDFRLAVRRKEVLQELEGLFADESNQFIFENRMGDAKGISEAVEQGLHARYLYLARR